MEWLKYKNNSGLYTLIPCSRFGMVIRGLIYTLGITALIYAFARQIPPVGLVAIAAVIGFIMSFSAWMFHGFPEIKKNKRGRE